MRVYLAPKVLIIDEMGYLPLDDRGAAIFFQLVSARLRTWQHHPDFRQELQRLGLYLRRFHRRCGDPGLPRIVGTGAVNVYRFQRSDQTGSRRAGGAI